jgi:response regulator NasT
MKLLLLATAPDQQESLRAAVKKAGHEIVAELPSFRGLLRASEFTNPDLILIRVDFLDDSTLAHLGELNIGKLRPIVVFTQDSHHIREAVRAGVSAYVINGYAEERLDSILEVAVARFNEDQALWRELMVMQDKLSDRKLIERAKGILMKNSSMSEEDAYQALRKEAMNQNLRLAEVAARVIQVGKLLTRKNEARATAPILARR